MKYALKIWIVFMLFPLMCDAQLSPGDLSAAHAELEGMSSCTLCHDLGDKVSSAKCLDCHKEINNLINQKRGYHSNKKVVEKDCFSCHSEHHGRKFEMIRFDEDNFDHDLAGYALKGKHKKIDCRDCHISDNIVDTEVSKKENTYLGLDNQCLSCHTDYHQETLSDDCAKCHNFEKFDPAKKFNHAKAKYKLEGKHKKVDCVKCHKKEIRNGQNFQIFTNLKYQDCRDCHDDGHKKRIKGSCTQCHSVNSFKDFKNSNTFEHNKQTHFKLKGKHISVKCFNCHKIDHNSATVFGDRKGISVNQCAKCHEDIHEGKFGNDCAKCHQESGFKNLKEMDSFNHDMTDFHLEGKHIGVDCKKCHISDYTDPIEYQNCKNCHDDYHHDEFDLKNGIGDCIDCHSLVDGFEISFFDIDDHEKTDFPLIGGHAATPCFACHLSEKDEKWTFSNIGSQCVDCHEDIHDGFLEEKYYLGKKCQNCHNSNAWNDVKFDHNLTDYALEDAHEKVDCRACHFELSNKSCNFKQNFSKIETNCSICHADTHNGQFSIEGKTDCVSCHNFLDWKANKFDHEKTKFPLEGAHVKLDCMNCHFEDENNFIIYKIEQFQCTDCHQ